MLPRIGFVGLGSMGGPMARNLLAGGYEVTGYDIDEDALGAAVSAGARAAGSVAEVVEAGQVVMTSLPYSHTWVEVAEGELVPAARDGQVFIDLGTVAPPETRRLAGEFAATGAILLDVPVSGGSRGAREGTLRMFAGGDRSTYEQCRPILEVLGDPERIVYCGPSGSGQVVKGINQMAAGMTRAVMLECLALGEHGGADLAAARQGVGGDAGWRAVFRGVAEAVLEGNGKHVGVK
ncbi:MAG: NAD(P)-dependent oxidoreductase, partial [Candidatus Brocadiaceae bacterium]